MNLMALIRNNIPMIGDHSRKHQLSTETPWNYIPTDPEYFD